jgi:hypothetical protein
LPRSDCRQRPPIHPIKQGGRFRSESVAAFRRNGWPPSVGMGGRLPSESVAALPRIPHRIEGAATMKPKHLPALVSGSLTKISAGERDPRVDFFRGLALIAIFIDHIANNVLSHFTFRSISFADAAEIFVFLAGYSAAIAYGHCIKTQGLLGTIMRIYKRAWQLYIAHQILFLAFAAETAFSVSHLGTSRFSIEFGLSPFMSNPSSMLIDQLALNYQPAFCDILPLYIVNLLAFPLVLVGLRRSPAATLVVSAACYVSVQLWGINLPANSPHGASFFFDPLAWQFLFVLGASAGFRRVNGAQDRTSGSACWLMAAALVIVATGALLQILPDAVGIGGHLRDGLLHIVGSPDKTTLAPVRLVNFLAFAVVIDRSTDPRSRFWSSPLARPVIACGKNSLEVFCTGVLLSVGGYFAVAQFGGSLADQLVVDLLGVATLVSLGIALDLFQKIVKSPSPLPIESLTAVVHTLPE